MHACPCSTDHMVTPEVAASVLTALTQGGTVSWDATTGDHRWHIPKANQTTAPVSEPLPDGEEVSMSDEVQPVSETETAPGDGQADQVREDEAVEQPVALLKPPPAYSGYAPGGQIAHP